MNFYGTTVGPQHTLVGRIAPMHEAFRLAIHRAANLPPIPTRYVHTYPLWAHNIADELTKTVFKGVVSMAPKNNQANEENASKCGQMLGLLIRMGYFYLREIPAQLERDGLNKLTAEQNQKLEKMSGLELMIPEVSELAGRPITSKEEVLNFQRRRAVRFAFQQIRNHWRTVKFIMNRPLGEISAFLSGIPKGFKAFLNDKGEFAKKGKRTEIFLLLLMWWPEIEEMRRSQPAKTRLDLLNWLEKQEGRQLVTDPKIFFAICDDIDLDMTTPGHPCKPVEV
jgi:hypothetical protein